MSADESTARIAAFRSSLAASIDAELQAGGSAQRAERERAYLESSVRHYGTSVPSVRAIVKATARRAVPVHERRLACVGRGDFDRFGRYADAVLAMGRATL